MSRLISDRGCERVKAGLTLFCFLNWTHLQPNYLLRGADTFKSLLLRCVIALQESVDVSFVIPGQSALIEYAILGAVIQYVADPIHPIPAVCILIFLYKQKQCLD